MAKVIREDFDKTKAVVIQNFVVARPPRRTNFDIGNWRSALDFAELKDNPNRVYLYDMYADVLLDPHLSRQWSKRVENITNTEWAFTEETTPNKEISLLIDTPEFEDILTEIMTTLAYGITALELGIVNKNQFGESVECLTVYSVPRKHIHPEKGGIVKEQYDSSDLTGAVNVINYREGIYQNYIGEIGKPRDLGLLLNIVPYVILKKGGVSDWATFVQLFGQPFREYRYNGYDEAVRQQLERSAQEMGSAPYIILPDGSTLTLHDIKNNNTGEVHSKLVQYCDEMISIYILGNTETTKSSKSSGYAQAEIHSQTQDDVYEADKRRVRRILNNIIRPILFNLGYPVKNGFFHPKEEKNIAKILERLKVIQMVKSMGVPVDDDIIYQDSDIPKPADYDKKKEPIIEENPPENEEDGPAPPANNKKKVKRVAKDGPTEKLRENSTLWDRFKLILNDFFRTSPADEVIPAGLVEEYYTGSCCIEECKNEIITLSADEGWKKILNDFAQQVHNAQIKGKQIHSGLYFKTAEVLANAITEGLGKSFSYDDPLNSLKAKFLSNIYQFSAAKSLTELAAINEMLLLPDGTLKSFNRFFQDVQKIHGLYNEQYLNAEYSNAVANSQMAVVWHQYDDDDWLEFRTAGDNRVREEHRKLDGIVQQKKSSFWHTHWPPLAWLCRCYVVFAKKPLNPISAADAEKAAKNAIQSPIFSNNAGLSGIIFTEDHPYFRTMNNLHVLDAVTNYGLRSVRAILKRTEELPARLHIDSPDDLSEWWQSMTEKFGVNATDFELKDRLGISILFKGNKNAFKSFISKNGRHEFAGNIESMIQQPDEIWSIKDVLQYVKYYNDGAYILSTVVDHSSVEAMKFTRIEQKDYDKIRKGVLLFRK